ncbi:MAG: helix-turn-helix transcriptional regulator [Acholeplasmataceae bacterium]|jgi:AcrR family transcriptional regulator|nr:helix-turn-helix transcriptional regulator [Acholeplasmataceae bacterium]
MSKLKNNVKEKIIKNAADEFYERGFSGANMRRIARKSRMVVGNIYRYFSSKEGLFNATVEPAYLALVELINVKLPDELESGNYYTFLEPVLNELTRICLKYPKEIVSILDRYIGVKDYQLFENLKLLIIKRLKNELPELSDTQSDIIFHLILRGVLFILQNYPQSELEKELGFLFVFIFKEIDYRI